MAKKRRPGRPPKLGVAATEQINIAFPLVTIEAINRARPEQYNYPGGTVDYLRHIILTEIGGPDPAIMAAAAKSPPTAGTTATWEGAKDDTTTA